VNLDIVIAVRGGGKSRLSPALSADRRETIVGTMLSDMLERLGGGGRLHVVTPTPALTELAQAAGAMVIPDPGTGLNAAFAAARAVLPGQFLALPGDLPLAGGVDVDRMRAALVPGRAAVAGTQGGGTGALLLPPGLSFRFAFGAHSLAWHRRNGAIEIDAPGFGLDIDTPEDIAALLARNVRCRTSDLLRSTGLSKTPWG
jgi:2-phospho-L-lactate guanylyltransferase